MAEKSDDSGSRPDDENPEWTANDMALARPASEVLPTFIGHAATDALMRRRTSRPAKEDRKVNQTRRLDQDVSQPFRREDSG